MNQGAGPLSRLPPEVLLIILTALGSLDVFELWTAARVCKAWRHLAFDNSLWKHLYFQFWRVRDDAELILAGKVAATNGDLHAAFPYFLRAARDSHSLGSQDVSSHLGQVDWYRLYAARFVLEHRWHAIDKPPSQLDQRLLPWSAPGYGHGHETDPRTRIPSEFQPPESFCLEKNSEEVKRAIYTAEIDDGADAHGTPWRWVSTESFKPYGAAPTAATPSLRATPQCPRIISGARDRSVRIWDGDTCALLFEATGHTASVLRLRLDGHEGRLYTAGSDGKVIVWDYVRMVSRHRVKVQPEDVILHVIQHPDRVLDIVIGAAHIVTCCMDGVARVFSKDGYCQTASHNHERAINGACFPDDPGASGQVITASSDKMLARWRVDSGAGVKDPFQLEHVPTSVAYGRGCLFLGSSQGAVLVQSGRDSKQQHEWAGHQGIIRALAVSPDRGIVVSAGHDGRTFLWRIGESGHTPVFTLRRSPYGLLCVSASVAKVVTGGKNGALCIRDFGDGLDTSIFA